MNSQKLSFVLPITFRERLLNLGWRDIPDTACEARFQLLLRSFLLAFALEELEQFLIVCPAGDEERVRTILTRTTSDSRFRIVNDLEICPELATQRKTGTSIPGWYIQQILKLAAATVINSTFYLTLDSDIVCRKPFSVGSLIPEGKALLNIETPKVYLDLYKEGVARNEWRIKRHWLRSSAGLLGYRRQERYHYKSYGETPVLMHTGSVRQLLAFLAQRHGNWFRCLAENRDWTEYTLFFQFLEMTGILETLYRKGDHNTVLDLEASVWKNTEQYSRTRDYSPGTIFVGRDTPGGTFVAVQSYLPTERWLPAQYKTLRDFYDDLEKHLGNFN